MDPTTQLMAEVTEAAVRERAEALAANLELTTAQVATLTGELRNAALILDADLAQTRARLAPPALVDAESVVARMFALADALDRRERRERELWVSKT